MNDQQRHALRWIVREAIAAHRERDFHSDDEALNEKADIESVIRLFAEADDREELADALA